MKYLSVLFFLFVLLACGEGKKDEVIDMKDITPQAKRDYDTTEKEPDLINDFGFNRTLADEFGVQVMEIDSIAEPMFPDRFSTIKKQKIALQLKADQIIFCQWIFKDSLKTMNTLFNWIDCFGSKCKSIKYRFNENFQSDHMLIFVNDTSITYLSSALPLDEKSWQQYFEKVNGIEEWDNVIIQKAKRKAGWYSYAAPLGSKEKKFLPFKE